MNEISLIVIGGTALFCKDLVGKILWSIILYLYREELNHDNDPTTPDKYLHYNKDVDKFTERYILRYAPHGVHWGFFLDGAFIQKFSFWLDWADDRSNRFPCPIEMKNEDQEYFVKILKKRI
jgi:hypothetical protein